MKKTIKLTESQLRRIVKNVINENLNDEQNSPISNEELEKKLIEEINRNNYSFRINGSYFNVTGVRVKDEYVRFVLRREKQTQLEEYFEINISRHDVRKIYINTNIDDMYDIPKFDPKYNRKFYDLSQLVLDFAYTGDKDAFSWKEDFYD